MTNIIKFPEKGMSVEYTPHDEVDDYMNLEQRVNSLAEILDLNIQGMYHTIDVEADEVMMALLELSAIWSVRAEIDPEDFISLCQGIRLEVTNAEET